MTMSDLVDELFSEQETYPGSKKKRREPPPEVEEADWQDSSIMKTVNGREIPMYTIGAMAQALGVSVSTVRAWIRKAHIPMATYRLPSNMIVAGEKTGGRRLYTAAQIEATVRIMRKHGLLGKPLIRWQDHEDVTIEISNEWIRISERNKGAL